MTATGDVLHLSQITFLTPAGPHAGIQSPRFCIQHEMVNDMMLWPHLERKQTRVPAEAG